LLRATVPAWQNRNGPPARIKTTVSATEHLLRLADEHIQAGRLPILKDSKNQALLEKASQRKISQYGRPLRLELVGGQKPLFERYGRGASGWPTV
jgi:hypothetical protein